jgi:2-keto-4-pentenoate hydratase/2-oxohepta-3-ene-1,7-dioic acid hydratase in catechol pathway
MSSRALSGVNVIAPHESTRSCAVGRNYAGHVREKGHEWPEEPFLYIKAPDSDSDPEARRLCTWVNGEILLDFNTSDFIFKPWQLIEYATAIVTPVPGDVVLTGTARGVGNHDPGEVVKVEIESISTLRNQVS